MSFEVEATAIMNELKVSVSVPVLSQQCVNEGLFGERVWNEPSEKLLSGAIGLIRQQMHGEPRDSKWRMRK